VFGGDLASGSSGGVAVARCLATTLANANRIARMTPLVFGTLSASDKLALVSSGASTPTLAVQVGQGYATFDLDGLRTYDVADPVDTNRLFQVSLSLTNR
jgi:hypothetical protein